MMNSTARRLLGRSGSVPRLTSRNYYTPTRPARFPTALARAERASDLKAHPEAAVTQEKLPDKKGNRHWTEDNATVSEADIRADREAQEKTTTTTTAEGSSSAAQDKKA
ncbi:hypothetical protein AYL99_06233 [Fonsecaea erecta]|uniref:Uncharacterized protein n=1 Tax=Fonsecaea erecta TaxID=1367422 RepID=A0A178ZHL3_9EURO|nr:hypothetical protein AYL99_06233 [Fonsecaea erecta]OAP58936.1 hypothetical protein AYL99_06233 [Fonsecaea erecta]